MRYSLAVVAFLVCVLLSACRDAALPSNTTRAGAPGAPDAAGAASVRVPDGLLAPPQVKHDQQFQAEFTLLNESVNSVTFEEVALAVLRPNGAHLYDAGHWRNVTVGASDTWAGNTVTSIFAGTPTGNYRLVARGRLPGGNWFNFSGAGNSATVALIGSGAFGAVVERVQMYPSSVRPGSIPLITASVRNTSTSDTEWGGHATFRITAVVQRNGQVVHQQVFPDQPFEPGATRIGFAPGSFDTSLPGRYDVRYIIRSGDDVHHFGALRESFWVESLPAATSCSPPPEATRTVSYAAFWRAPFGYKGATPWLTVVHDTRRAGTSTVDIDFIRLWARTAGVTRLVAANEFDGNPVFGGELRRRDPWFSGSAENMPGTIQGGSLRIRPSDRPEMVWHPYLNRFPRDDISAADSVWIEIRLRISGPALVQAGLDYWKELGGVSGAALEEAGTTDWICDSEVWHTLTLEPSTEVSGPIHLFTNPPGSSPRVNSPVEAVYVIRNRDDDTVRLTAFGIETRRIVSGDQECDPALNELETQGFRWHSGVVLPPGGRFGGQASWTPRVAGRYCVTIVEKREDTPENIYQRTYFRVRHQWVDVAP